MDQSRFENLIEGMFGVAIVLAILLIFYLIFYIACQWKLFKKTGKHGWEAIIPFYNTWVLIEISGLNWWYFLLAISPNICNIIGFDNLKIVTNIISIAVNFFIFYNLAKKMHKEPIGIAIAGALVSGIMIPIMALSKNYQYDSSIAVSPNGPIGNNEQNTNQEQDTKYCLGCGQKLDPNTKFCQNCGRKV